MTACTYFLGKTCDGVPSDVHCRTCLLFLKLVGAELYRRNASPVRPKGPVHLSECCRNALAPQKVADAYSSWATGDIFQRKVLYDGSNFFVFWWNGMTAVSPYYISHKVSSNGINWGAAVNDFSFSVGPGCNVDIGGNIDAFLKASGTCYIEFLGSNPQIDYPREGTIVESAITWASLWSISFSSVNCVGGNVAFTPAGRFYYVKHGRHTGTLVDNLILVLPEETLYRQYTTSVPAKSGSTGGVQVLPYKTSVPYNLLVLLKDASDTLYYSIINDVDYSMTLPMTSMEVTLASGFNSFSACSEAQAIGASEKIHLVYIKSTGELCYNKFSSDAWGTEVELVASGATYPVIGVGASGKLYVFFVSGGIVNLKYFDGVEWYPSVSYHSDRHTYSAPAYLSCNQNIQSGKLCLVWTEGTDPYEIWFTSLEET